MTSTAEVLGHHMEAIGAGDLEGLLSDYAPDAVDITPNGTFSGTDEIKAFFEGFIENFIIDVNEASGEYGQITWHSGDAAPLGTDTFHVVNGKFAMQSFAAYIP